MEELTQSKLREFAALRRKTERRRTGLYLAEGRKLVYEALTTRQHIAAILYSQAHKKNQGVMATQKAIPHYLCAEHQLERISTQETPEGIIAVIHRPKEDGQIYPEEPALWLHEIKDPGNLGTLIRTAEWFGIRHIYGAPNCVDPYNPKVVRAAMGALFRVRLTLVEDFEGQIHRLADRMCAAVLEGDLPAQVDWGQRYHLLLGSESHGLPPRLMKQDRLQKVRIPGRGKIESLNVAVAGGILSYQLMLYQLDNA